MFAWEDFPNYRISPAIHSDLRHEDVVRQLESFQSLSPDSVQIERLGESVERRSISLLTLGNGAKQVLAWSQMHGNEPTHTAVLLDLVSFLLNDPEHPTAKAILQGCKLHFIVMLNPDGAERWTRRNAQYIDINRDALQRQSPEGQILHAAVKAIRPDFALNLHNHRPHTTVGLSQQPASFSLLVPPIDAVDTETANVLVAKQLAGTLANAVAPHCPGQVSRYHADFMPRCFGEWVQQQGTATMTVEAGGWSTVDAEPLVQLHFFGLVACLEAIATDRYLEVTPETYENLPRTGEHDLFDKLIRGVTILNGLDQEPFRADLGINFTQTVPTTRGGRIVDLGDLHVTSGKMLTAGDHYICLPGRIAWLPHLTPSQLLTTETITELLGQGVTTAIGQVDLADDEELANLHALRNEFESPINLAFLAKLTLRSPEILDRLLKAISQGILAVLADGLPAEVHLYLSLFNFPIVSAMKLPRFSDSPATLSDSASRTQQCAQVLGMEDRGAIRLGEAADLVVYQSSAEFDARCSLADCDLQRVIVGGNVVFDQGQLTHESSGVLLRSKYGQN